MYISIKKIAFVIIFIYANPAFSSIDQNKLLTIPSPADDAEYKLTFGGRHGVFPVSRLVVYYGNFYSSRMGILGEYSASELWKRLRTEAQEWEKNDPSKPVITGLHYIATVASNHPGKDGLYRNRMSNTQIQKALSVVRMEPGSILILDVQPGLSDLQREIARLDPFLTQPDVHLGVDPEFIMTDKAVPGHKIGTISYKDINRAIDHLSELVVKYQLPPKILVIHRFTKKMVTGFDRLKSDSNVQVVLNMDGWGSPKTKILTYEKVISSEKNILYSGIKLFYKNDIKQPPYRLLSKEEVLRLQPQPIYIQYQ